MSELMFLINIKNKREDNIHMILSKWENNKGSLSLVLVNSFCLEI